MTKYIHKEWNYFCRKQPQWVQQGYWFGIPKEIRSSNIAFKTGYYTRLEALLCVRGMLSEADVDPFLLMLHIDRIKIGRQYIFSRPGHPNRVKYSNLKPLTPAEKRFVTRRNTQ